MVAGWQLDRLRPRPSEGTANESARRSGGSPVVLATLEWQGGPTEVAWSPRGDWIAWAAETFTLYSPDGKVQRKLGEPHPHLAVGFSPDGKILYACYLE